MIKYSKLKFYYYYLYFKIRIPVDVKEGKINIFVAEIIWILGIVFKKKLKLPDLIKKEYFVTKFGKFYITPDLLSVITVSPAFERLDTNYLEKLILKQLEHNKKVLFIDIGAYFGDYSVRLGNRFKNNENFYIYAVEPGTEYLSASTLEQLKRNIKINHLKNIKIFPFGIGSKNEINKIGIHVKPLDQILKVEYKKFDVVFIKLDIDDYVIDGLIGIEKSTNSFKETYLLVEDFILPQKTFKFLKQSRYILLNKLTPYNSFWYKQK